MRKMLEFGKSDVVPAPSGEDALRSFTARLR
jgi:hypothetical protein